MRTKVDISSFEFMPRCQKCNSPVAYRVAPHNVPDCPLKVGEMVLSEELAARGIKIKNSLEYAVMDSYAEYPSLYGRSAWSRWRIFDQLFFVIGNGYEWYQGRLQSVFSPKSKKIVWRGYEPSKFTHAEWEAAMDRRDYQNTRQITNQWDSERGSETIYYFSESRYEEQNNLPEYFYRVCEYSKIMTVPKDVQPDWLAGCYEALAMLEYQPATSKTDFFSNIDFVDVIKKRLDAISESRA